MRCEAKSRNSGWQLQRPGTAIVLAYKEIGSQKEIQGVNLYEENEYIFYIKLLTTKTFSKRLHRTNNNGMDFKEPPDLTFNPCLFYEVSNRVDRCRTVTTGIHSTYYTVLVSIVTDNGTGS